MAIRRKFTGSEGSTADNVVAFRRRRSDRGIGAVRPDSTDVAGELDEYTDTQRPDPAGGEVLLW